MDAKKSETFHEARTNLSRRGRKTRTTVTAAELDFCACFVLTGNVKQASLQAGYAHPYLLPRANFSLMLLSVVTYIASQAPERFQYRSALAAILKISGAQPAYCLLPKIAGQMSEYGRALFIDTLMSLYPISPELQVIKILDAKTGTCVGALPNDARTMRSHGRYLTVARFDQVTSEFVGV
jgi:hypothetical protein